MKKLLIFLLLAACLLFAACGSEAPSQSGKTVQGSNVSLVLPASFFQAGLSESEIVEQASSQGMLAVANADGTYTYTMDVLIHQQMLLALDYGLQTSFAELLANELLPLFVSIEPNQWYTKVDVTINEEVYDKNPQLCEPFFRAIGVQCNNYQVFYGAGLEAEVELTIYNEKNKKLRTEQYRMD